MTEAAYQAARKVMQKANYWRGRITVAKKHVAKWTKFEDANRRAGKIEQAEGCKKMLDYAIEELKTKRKQFAAMQFPDPNMKEAEVNRCKDCGAKIAPGNEYCGECMCENDMV